MKTNKTKLAIASVLAIQLSLPASAAVMCNDLFKSMNVFSIAEKTKKSEKLKNVNLDYPAFVDSAKNPDQGFKFGFESEYTTQEIASLLKYYKPVEISASVWEMKTDAQRSEYIAGKMSQATEAWAAQGSGLVLYKAIPDTPKIPKELSLDTTGNLEIIVEPMDNIKEYMHTKNKINSLFGVGSMQSTFSIPWKPFFDHIRKTNKVTKIEREHLKNYEGYFKLSTEIDIFQKLETGFERLNKGTTNLVARSFQHPYLGPFNLQKQERMMKYFVLNANGEKVKKEDLSFLKERDSSFKYAGTTVYRPDIATEKALVWEIRDAHKDDTLLESKVKRHVNFFAHESNGYDHFIKLDAFDRVAAFEILPQNVKEFLLKTIGKKETELDWAPAEIENANYYKNFAWPMRDWKPFFEVLNLSKNEIKEIKKHQWAYVNRLSEIANLLKTNQIDKQVAQFETHAALVKFSHEADLLRKLVNADQTMSESKKSQNETNFGLAN